uniref:Uncharacterized protein n=1 Tax=Glossina morsitans morsitans TaxID=37546 RepID=A0A1B0GG67_GLOMM
MFSIVSLILMEMFLALIYCLLSLYCVSNADESPGFFLKIPKNIPRLGRRSALGSKQENSVSTLNDWFISSASRKRALFNAPLLVPERELAVVQPVNSNTLLELLEKDAIANENIKFVHWKDFDLALQLDGDLYDKVSSLGRRPDQSLKQDLTLGGYVPIISSNALDNSNRDYRFYGSALEPYTSRYKIDLLGLNDI